MRTTYWFLLLGLMLLTVCLALLIPLFTGGDEPRSANTSFVMGGVYDRKTAYHFPSRLSARTGGREHSPRA